MVNTQHKPKILLLDQDLVSMSVAKIILEKLNYQITTRDNYPGAMHHLRQTKEFPHLILMDTYTVGTNLDLFFKNYQELFYSKHPKSKVFLINSYLTEEQLAETEIKYSKFVGGSLNKSKIMDIGNYIQNFFSS